MTTVHRIGVEEQLFDYNVFIVVKQKNARSIFKNMISAIIAQLLHIFVFLFNVYHIINKTFSNQKTRGPKYHGGNRVN